MKALAWFGVAAFCGAALVGSVACGASPATEAGDSPSEAHSGKLVMVSSEASTAAALPACRASIAGTTAVAASEDALQTCEAGQWTAITRARGAEATLAYNHATDTLWARSSEPDGLAARWTPVPAPRGSDTSRQQLLEAVALEPSGWELNVAAKGATVAQGSAAHAEAISGNPGEGFGCPDKLGCTSLGEEAGQCLYLCKVVTYGP
jgi:hypothetical protein